MSSKKYYVYKTTNLVTGRYYIGVHSSANIKSDRYLGSGVAIRDAITKYGRASFIREIIEVFDKKELAYELERTLVTEETIHSNNMYNLRNGGVGGLSAETIEKIKKTNFQNRGVEHVFQDKNVRCKIEITMMEKYGVKTPCESPQLLEKRNNTCIERYGQTNVMKNREVIDRNIQTNLEKRGVRRPAQDKTVKEKTAKTFMSRYGVRTMSQIPEVREKIREANSGKNSHCYGMKWIFNKRLKLRTKIPKNLTDHISKDWEFGRGGSKEEQKSYIFVRDFSVATG